MRETLTKESNVMVNELKINETFEKEWNRLRDLNPSLKKISFSYKVKHGLFLVKLKAKTSRQTFHLSGEDRIPEISIRRVFSNLSRLIGKEKTNKYKRIELDFFDVA